MDHVTVVILPVPVRLSCILGALARGAHLSRCIGGEKQKQASKPAKRRRLSRIQHMQHTKTASPSILPDSGGGPFRSPVDGAVETIKIKAKEGTTKTQNQRKKPPCFFPHIKDVTRLPFTCLLRPSAGCFFENQLM